MKKNIENRAYCEAEFILKYGSTVREVAKYFYVSKSTVHYDITVRLKKLDLSLFKMVDKVMKNHLMIRHIRGGEATKKKYESLKVSNGKIK